MADTDPATGAETVAPVAPSNEPGNAAVPPVVNSSADVEAAKRETEQARMRANQLENELKKVKETQEAADRQKLEETQEFKALYEKSNADLKALQETQERELRQTQLNTATEEVFKEYPTEVVELAKTAGLSLNDDSEAGTAALKEKLDAFKARVSPNASVSSSNPAITTPVETGESGGLGRPRSLGVDTGQVTLNPEPNQQKVHEYLGNLQSIKQMKLDSGHFKEA